MKYIALLRGINVGGNNKVAMSDLRASFEEAGLKNVSTYINSGNVLFESDETKITTLISLCESVIEKKFGFPVVVMVISQTDFNSALKHAPEWWGNKDQKKSLRSDALFVITPTTTAEVRQAMKVKSDGPDKFSEQGQVIFWSLPLESYTKSVVPKIIGTPIYKQITIRSSTTVYKLQALLESS
jgi:uncharacterized protein (DUF1697 family)